MVAAPLPAVAGIQFVCISASDRTHRSRGDWRVLHNAFEKHAAIIVKRREPEGLSFESCPFWKELVLETVEYKSVLVRDRHRTLHDAEIGYGTLAVV